MSSDAPLPSSFDDNPDFFEESRWAKFSRKLVEEPLIPLGCGLTCLALLGATRSIRAGDHERANVMFRRRIYAQGFTLLALVVGSMYWQGDRDKRAEFDEALADKKKMEKRDAWIAELEKREAEDEEARETLRRRMQRIREREGRLEGAADKKSVLDHVEETAKKALGRDEGSKSMLEACERRGVLAAVRDLGWPR